ncbi:MAG: alpha-amylase, partial [Gammaproteobacteria bacterium]|nr:alpha-amylase [Gammaproteobacteria bacterium]
RLAHYYPANGVYAWFRYDDQSRVMAVINKNEKATALDFSRFAEHIGTATRARDVIGGRSIALGRKYRLPGRSVLLLELD